MNSQIRIVNVIDPAAAVMNTSEASRIIYNMVRRQGLPNGRWDRVGAKPIWKHYYAWRPFLRWGWMPWLRREKVGGIVIGKKPVYRWRWWGGL